MRIRMRTTSAGANGVRAIGEICDVSLIEGEQLIAGGYAEQLPDIAGGLTPEIITKAKELDVNPPPSDEDPAPVSTKKKYGKK